MSCLLYINDYGSDTESDCEIEQNLPKRKKLPVPDLSRVITVPSETVVDEPGKHDGRKRTFPHVRGNWATFVYVQYSIDETFATLRDKLLDQLSGVSYAWHLCENHHISLSKTVVLNYHWITPFHTSLQKAIETLQCFKLEFDALQVFCNEDKTRTFIVLETNKFSHKKLLSVTNEVDAILNDYKLPKFYNEPSFHVSILWTNGDRRQETSAILDNLNNILAQVYQESTINIVVDKIYCKSGNKTFQYHLKNEQF